MSVEQEAKKGVLVVEDDDELRHLFTMMLELEHFVVFEANAGEVGLSTLNQNMGSIHVMITDLGLPGIGGVDLITQARAAKPAIKIIGTSGFGSQNVRDMVLTAGADDFFAKPFSPMDIVQRVKEFTK